MLQRRRPSLLRRDILNDARPRVGVCKVCLSVRISISKVYISISIRASIEFWMAFGSSTFFFSFGFTVASKQTMCMYIIPVI